ncbi:MAG: hypothetical protein IH604_12670 [Burkholderiales bacterium]|nr:hypothetical protein [Burkholderiales bacterium]
MRFPQKKQSAADYIRSELLIREGEGGTLAYFLALFFLLGLGLALGRGSANALFLKHFGVAYLPHVYLALSLCLGLSSLGYAALADRIAPEKLFAGMAAVFAAVLVIIWVLMRTGATDLAFPIYLVNFGVISEVVLLHATLYFGANFDGDQVKRLLPLALAGIQAGELSGGLVLAGLSVLMPMKDVLLLWVTICAASVALIIWRHRRYGNSPYTHPPRRGSGALRAAADQLVQGLRFARQSDLLRYSSYGVLFMVIAVFTLSYSVMTIYAANFHTETELGIIFGLTTFVGGAVTLLAQIFFSGKLLQRFGVRRMNLVFPLTTLASFAGLILSFTLPSALLAAFNQSVIMPAIRNPSRNLLFQALPDYMQGRARALSLVLVLPLGILTAGVLLQLLRLGNADWMLPATGTLAALAYLVYSAKTNRAYLGAVLSTMAEKLYIPREHMGALDTRRDRELFELLARGAAHADEQISITYAKVLMDAFPAEAPRIVLERLQSAGLRTRDQLIRLVVPKLPETEKTVLHDYLRTSDPHQQATILDILFVARDAVARSHVRVCLESDNPRLTACGILGVHCYNELELMDEATRRWNQLLRGAQSPSLLAGLDLLRRRPDETMFDAAAKLLVHPEDRVKRAALLGLAQFASVDAATLTPLIGTLLHAEDHTVRMAAVQCALQLAAGECRKHCHQALEDRHPRVVQAALEVLKQLDGKDFVATSLDWLDANEGSPRAQCAMVELLLKQPVPSGRLEAFVRSRLGAAMQIAGALRLVEKACKQAQGQKSMELLALALRESLGRIVALALTALEGLEDRQLVRTVRAGLASRDARQEARAFEALEDLGARDIAAALRVIFGRGGVRERGSVEAAGPSLGTISDVVDYFAQGRDAWLQDCASFARRGLMKGAA